MEGIVKFKQLPYSEIMVMATTFAESGMFSDAKQAAQAFVKIQAGNEIGIPPFQAMSGINIVMGKTTIGAGIMASRVKASGKYNYVVRQLDDNGCVLEFFKGNELLGKSEFNSEHAKKQGTKNLDKFPRNMFFARAMSNGVKWFTPDVFDVPVYVPEDFMDIKPPVEDQGYANEISKTNEEKEITDAEKKIGEQSVTIIHPEPEKKVEVKNNGNTLLKQYLTFIEANFSLELQSEFTSGCETWSEIKLQKAMNRVKEIVNQKNAAQ